MEHIKIAENLKSGLINWYPFEPGKSVAFYGEVNVAFRTDILSRGLSEADENAKSDYIIAIGALETAEHPINILQEMKSRLTDGGHLFLACDNRLALRYFAGDKDPFTDRVLDGIENYANLTEADKRFIPGRAYARYEILDFLRNAGITDIRGYSILPGLEMPQQIYSWNSTPSENLEIRYTRLYQNPSSVYMNIEKTYDSIVQNDMFHQTANAYLIDYCSTGDYKQYAHVTTSMDRGEESATATIICDDEKVIKKALYPQGNAGIKALMENNKRLNAYGIKTVPLKCDCGEGDFENGSCLFVEMPFVKAPTALEYLRQLADEDLDKFKTEVSRFLDTILQSSEDSGQQGELAPYYKHVYIDLVPLNCFYENGEFLFFDQEFCAQNYPIKVVLVRALDIIYMGDKALEDKISSKYFYEKYNLSDKINQYRVMGTKFIENLRSQDKLQAFNSAHIADNAVINANRQRMNFSDDEYKRIFINILDDVADKKLYLFGSGAWARKFIAEFKDRVEIEALLDNGVVDTCDGSECEKIVDGIKVYNPNILQNQNPDDYKVIVCIKSYAGVIHQLRYLGTKNYGIYDPNIDRPGTSVSLEEIESCVDANSKVSAGEKPNAPVDAKSSASGKPYHIGYVAGVFDLFHIGHLNILRRAKEQCDILLVGVVSDEQASKGKARSPYVNENERCEIVEACKYVDKAFVLPIAAAGTRDVYRKYHFDAQFSGSDYANDSYWLEEQKWLRDHGAELVFFPYTETVSSTKLKTIIEKE